MDANYTKDEIKIRILVLLAIADKEFHESEDKMIKNILKEHQIESKNYDVIRDQVLNSPETFDEICANSLKQIKDSDEQQDLLKILFVLSMADYILHEDEIRFIELCAKEWGVYGDSFKEMIKDNNG
tara:strand:- start:125 stop:505 length:381 start_codon:yes stop_codon:yes gene_type:complete